ncbi:MAG: lysophospholipid acyltransferase family protein [Sediminispirochaetaceae bacterium]
MMYSLFFYFKFWLFMTITLPMIIPLWLLRLGGFRKLHDRYLLWGTGGWARFVMRTTPAEITVKGMDKLPSGGNLVFVANHQSAYDIPLIMAVIPRNIGFIAKKELKFLPIVSGWMRAMKCIFIDRSSPRRARSGIDRAIANLRNGHSMVVFPEGTRSRSNRMGEFHRGSLQIAYRAGSTIVPLTIKDSYRLREEHDRITPGAVELTIHPPVETAGMTRQELQGLSGKLSRQIAGAL